MNAYPTLLESLSGHYNFHRSRHATSLYTQFLWVSRNLRRQPISYEPFDSVDLELSRLVLERAESIYGTAWFHGGNAVLKPGEELLPPTVTGFSRPFFAHYPKTRQGLVFVTRSLAFARSWAECRGGYLYEIEPDRGVTVAPYHIRALRMFEDWIGQEAARATFLEYCLLEFTCKSACVLKELKV